MRALVAVERVVDHAHKVRVKHDVSGMAGTQDFEAIGEISRYPEVPILVVADDGLQG